MTPSPDRLCIRLRNRCTAWLPVFVAMAGLMVFATGEVLAQDLQGLLDRLDRLERDVRTLNVQLARDGAVASTLATGEGTGQVVLGQTPASVAHMDARLTAIENDLRATTGSFEELGFRISQLTDRLDKLIGDVDFRLSELEKLRSVAGASPVATGGDTDPLSQDEVAVPQVAGETGILGTLEAGTLTAEQLAKIGIIATEPNGTGNEPASSGAPAVAGPARDPEPVVTGIPDAAPTEDAIAALSPEDAYARAFALLRQARYDEAAGALQAFVDDYSGHELSSNARYWLGETFYVRSQFVRAAEIFFEAYRLSPQGPKAPDNLLKLGMALGNLDKQPEACAAFVKLDQEFPDPSSAITAKLSRERGRNNCGAG